MRRRVALLTVGAVVLAGFGVASRLLMPTVDGAALFAKQYTPREGLGPQFNDTSCVGCHRSPAPGGMGPNGLATVLRVGRLDQSGFDPLIGQGGPVARAHSVGELLPDCQLRAGIPDGANMTSVRNAPTLFGLGGVARIPEAVILAGAGPRKDGVNGRPNMVDGAVGRFGWKADEPSLSRFVAVAFHNELGITSPQEPTDTPSPEGCGTDHPGPDVDQGTIDAVTSFVAALPSPAGHPPTPVFEQVGCAACHVPNLGGVPLYSDLLIHDMGRSLNDGVPEFSATGADWRTTPLWGLGQRQRFLHDGRATTIDAAIIAHAGEADVAVGRFRALSTDDRAALLEFLRSL